MIDGMIDGSVPAERCGGPDVEFVQVANVDAAVCRPTPVRGHPARDRS